VSLLIKDLISGSANLAIRPKFIANLKDRVQLGLTASFIAVLAYLMYYGPYSLHVIHAKMAALPYPVWTQQPSFLHANLSFGTR
jgi:hypothetical protein